MQPALEERQADGTARIRRAGQKARRGEGERFDDELLFAGSEKKRIIANGRFILCTGGPHAEQIIARKIGRASCRERVEISVVAVTIKKKKKIEAIREKIQSDE